MPQKRNRRSVHGAELRRQSRRSSVEQHQTLRLSPISEVETPPPRKRASRGSRRSVENWEHDDEQQQRLMPVVTGPILQLRDRNDLLELRRTLEPVRHYFQDVIDKHELTIEPTTTTMTMINS